MVVLVSTTYVVLYGILNRLYYLYTWLFFFSAKGTVITKCLIFILIHATPLLLYRFEI